VSGKELRKASGLPGRLKERKKKGKQAGKGLANQYDEQKEQIF
jgi:hypothetical protein